MHEINNVVIRKASQCLLILLLIMILILVILRGCALLRNCTARKWARGGQILIVKLLWRGAKTYHRLSCPVAAVQVSKEHGNLESFL